MNRSYLASCLGVFFLVATFSCKKQDQISSRLTGSFITDSIVTISAPVMYTSNSMITDSNFIKSYVSRLSSWYPNPFPCSTCSFTFKGDTEAATNKIQIGFVSRTEGTVEFDNYGKTDCIVRVENNNALFISKDTVPLGSGSGPCSVVNNSVVYKAPYENCLPLSTSSGTSYSCESQPIELVVAVNGDLFLPVVKAFTGKTGTSSGSCYFPARFLNVFNSGLQRSLGNTDTVVIQQKRWNLRKL